MSTTGIVIQARMTSKRFPGKSMAILLGKPVIQHVIERAKLIRDYSFVQNVLPHAPIVILAVPDKPESAPMIDLAGELGIEYFSGSEHDVLSRYYHCAKSFELKTIMRITGDCPFIAPPVCSELLKMHKIRKFDYTCNVMPRTYPTGMDCEIMTFDALEAAWAMAVTISDREHVTPWLQRTEGIERGNMRWTKPGPKSVLQPGTNLCVDFPSDIERLEVLYRKMCGSSGYKQLTTMGTA